MNAPIGFTVTRTAAAPVDRLFAEVVAEDVLPKVLPRYRVIPAVVATRDNTGPWDTPGSTRHLEFADGGSAREQVTEWESPSRFAYRVDEFTSALRHLVTHATGEWDFTSQGQRSQFTWTYTFYPRSAVAARGLGLFLRLFWRGYMRQAADLCVRLADAPRESH
jgi:Polyketide cyclase / dehydrase and lipid transport